MSKAITFDLPEGDKLRVSALSTPGYTDAGLTTAITFPFNIDDGTVIFVDDLADRVEVQVTLQDRAGNALGVERAAPGNRVTGARIRPTLTAKQRTNALLAVSGGGSSVTGSTGSAVTSTAQIATDVAMTSTYTLDRVPVASRAKALQPFWTKLANRDAAPVDVLFLGSSFIEGAKAGSWKTRVSDYFINQLRNLNPTTGIAGGTGYKSFREWQVAGGTAGASDFPDTPMTVTGGAVSADYGLGRKAAQMSASGHKVVCANVDITGFSLIGTKYSTTGVGYYKVDGGASVPFTPTSTATDDGELLKVTGLSAGNHTIEVGWTSGSNLIVHGLMLYKGDESAGLRVWNSGRGSAQSSTFLPPSEFDGAGTVGALRVIKAVQPALVVIEVIGNDVTQASAPASLTKSRIQQIITDIRGFVTTGPSFVINLPFAYNTVGTGNTRDGHNQVAYEIAAADPLVTVFDMRQRAFGAGPLVSSATPLVDADGIHPSAAGNRIWGESLARFVSPS